MPHFNNRCHFKSIFETRRNFAPAVPVEEKDEDGEIHEVMKPIVKKQKGGGVQYLPGERLLIKLDKERRKCRKASASESNHGNNNELDMDKLLVGMSNVLREF